MSRILVKTYQLNTECACELRIEQWTDEKKQEFGVMVVGKPCTAVICDGRKQADMVKKWLMSRGGELKTINGHMVH